MKVKIKDLTKKQINYICKIYSKRDHNNYVHCSECPLSNNYLAVCIKVKEYRKLIMQLYGNKEIEIKEKGDII